MNILIALKIFNSSVVLKKDLKKLHINFIKHLNSLIKKITIQMKIIIKLTSHIQFTVF